MGNVKMRLTNDDKFLLKDWGFPEEDFDQIETAFMKKYTTYKLLKGGENEKEETISREKALEILGREQYLSGIGRSAFHWTSVRENDEGKCVYFNSSKLFK